MTDRRILVTAALPYANGPIHLGHLVEYLQTDIWVRYQKLRGRRCIYLCADDTHGTAVMISAKRAGVTEEEFIARVREEHVRDFAGFDIEFDNYGSTHCHTNRELCHRFWQSLLDAGRIESRSVTQLFDPVAGTFLADRFVKGTCPRCKSPEQYGDSCDKCGSTYAATDLIEPRSVLSGAAPVLGEAPHLFVKIEPLRDFLDEWTQTGDRLQPEVASYLNGHFLGSRIPRFGDYMHRRANFEDWRRLRGSSSEAVMPDGSMAFNPLRDWDVSRPAPYFGFEIPGYPNNFWYVWFDAPIGYIASLSEWCEHNGEAIEDWWPSGMDAESRGAEIHHFIGKDITYFHTLFWPSMLVTAGFKLPKKVHVHGFLTVDGQKMSKSKGTFIRAATYLDYLDPSYLRYYFASKLGPNWNDLDLNLEDFQNKVNADLVGKVVNLASRTARFVAGQKLAETYPDDGGLFAAGAAKSGEIADAYERGDFMTATREIAALADAANRFVEETAPWSLKKDPTKAEQLRDACTVSLNLFRQVVVYLGPVLPRLAKQAGELLNTPITRWEDAETPLTGTAVSEFKHMLQRVDPAKVQAMIDESKPADAPAENAAPAAEAAKPAGGEYLEKEPLAAECTIEDFMKVDLRVAEVLSASPVEGADKLIQLTLSLGGGNTRNVFAGIKSAYKPEDLVGRLVICCANLAPRKMRFGVSEGMVCAAGAGGKEIFVLTPDSGAKPGMRVH